MTKNFLDNLTKAVPYKVHNGIQFVKREGAEAYWAKLKRAKLNVILGSARLRL